MEVGETGAWGVLQLLFIFFWCNQKCMCAFGWALDSLYSEYMHRHDGCSVEYALKFSSFREVIGRLTAALLFASRSLSPLE